MWRAVAAGVSVAAGAGSGVVASLVTAHPAWGLWTAVVVLVAIGGALQAVVTFSERKSRSGVTASGAGSVAVGGSASEIRTRVQGSYQPVAGTSADGVVASGAGAVGVGGDMSGPVSTDVANTGGQAAP
jgi:hypothetical protein